MGTDATAVGGGPAVQNKSKAESGGIRIIRWLTDSHVFKWFIFGCIVVNSAMIGYDANFGPQNAYHELIERWNSYFLYIYTAELALEFLAAGPSRYFRQGWNLFDLVIVAAGYMAVIPGITAVRSLRVIRVFRLVSNVPAMRHVVEALLHALPGIFATVLVLSVVFFIGAVMGTTLFHSEEGFQNLGQATISLLALSVFDNWSDTVNRIDQHHPYAWTFLISFTIISAFAVLNLFIGVIVDAVQHTKLGVAEEIKKEVKQVEKDVTHVDAGVTGIAAAQEDAASTQAQMLAELRALRAEVASLRGAAPPAS